VSQTMLETGATRTQAMSMNQPFSNDFDYGANNFGKFDPFAAYYGGKISKYASGGHISGKPGIDQIPAMLSEGEYVIRASSARQVGKPMLDMINSGKFNDGGSVDKLAERMDSNSSGGNTNNISISVNVNKGKASGETEDSKSNNPADVSDEKEKHAAMAQKIKSQVVNVIIEEQRPGGLLSD